MGQPRRAVAGDGWLGDTLQFTRVCALRKHIHGGIRIRRQVSANSVEMWRLISAEYAAIERDLDSGVGAYAPTAPQCARYHRGV